MSFFSGRIWKIIVDSFWKMIVPGIKLTIPLTVLSFIFALIISIVVAIIQYSHTKILDGLCKVYIWIIRGTPVLVQLYLVFYGLPKIGIRFEAFTAAVIVFAFNEGAYMAESMRAALEAVPKGQLEAGYCVGMSYWQIMRRIILPQALRTAFPSLGNSFISLTKGTSLAANITIVEMFRTAQVIVARVYEPLVLYTEVALIYLVFCSFLTWLQNYGEKKLSAYGGAK